MELEVDEKELKAAGAELLTDGRRGLRINGWEISSFHGSILNSSTTHQWEQKLETSHLPEMVFGNSYLVLKHVSSGIKIHFNAFDALSGWKQEGLPPVEVPAAAKWKFRSKPFQQVILDYDYTFTTPYCGSETIENEGEESFKGSGDLCWEDCKEQIDMVALASKEPILFYDEVVLYEDELADNGVSLLTVKVVDMELLLVVYQLIFMLPGKHQDVWQLITICFQRVMPSGWFILLRFWLRVDGVLMRLRETRVHCVFRGTAEPVILRECCWREATFQALIAKGHPTDSAAYSDPNIISQRLPVIMHKTQKLTIHVNP